MLPVFSRLCDVDRKAYFRYLDSLDIFHRAAVKVSCEDGSEARCVVDERGGSEFRRILGAGGEVFVDPVARACRGSAWNGRRWLAGANDVVVGRSVGESSERRSGAWGVASGVVEEEAKSDVGGDGCVGTDGICGDELRGEQSAAGDGEVSGSGASVEACGVAEKEVSRGVNYERNKKNREDQRKRKQRRKEMGQDWRKGRSVGTGESKVGAGVVSSEGFWGSCTPEVRQQLIESKAKMHIAENDRIAEKARRQLAVYSANDVSVEAKRYGTGVRASLERSMVSIEKTHGTLVSTDNVPGEFRGSVETVVSSGSISPNSSVSEAEVRKMQKDLLDRDAVIRKFEERFGLRAAMLEYVDKDIWTDNSENARILDELLPDGYGMDKDFIPEGKFRVC